MIKGSIRELTMREIIKSLTMVLIRMPAETLLCAPGNFCTPLLVLNFLFSF